ncbi:MAG TPA: acetate uptake transporter [Solirubrobacteraceae bacterium]|nr:acetate uptake transporter [Solirubrobacteraceae bacterium]
MGATNMPRVAERAPMPAADGSSAAAGSSWKPANPAPLGLTGFATTTFVLSMINANLVSGTALPVVLGLALAYGGIGQLLAGMWEFRTGNTFGACAFSSYGAFWISFFVLVQLNIAKIPGGEVNSALGLYLWAWGIFTSYMFVASLRTTGAVALVFLLLAATFIILGIGNSGGDSGIIHLGGYVGLVTAAVAWYASFAIVLNETWGRTVLPVFPLGG